VEINKKANAQQPFLAIANFVVSSRSRFARIFIFNGKYKVPKFATDEKRRNVMPHCRATVHPTNIWSKTEHLNIKTSTKIVTLQKQKFEWQ
jgi:hypothetical protein